MKRKQVLALLMCATIIAGNVTTASAADIVSKDGQIVFTEVQDVDDSEKVEQKDNNKEEKEVKKVKKEKKTEKASDKTRKATDGKKAEVPLKSISLNKSSLNMPAYTTFQLKVIYNPTNTTVNKKVKWSGDVENIRVDQNGLVTAYGPGSTTITAEVGGKKASCKVTAKYANIESVKFEKPELKMKVGEEGIVYCAINPEYSRVLTDSAFSSDDSVVTVEDGINIDGKEKITLLAHKPGTATLTFKATTDGEKYVSDTMKITVTEKGVDLESISLNKTALSGEVGDTEKLTVSYNPNNTTVDKTVNWSTSDKKVATVDKDGNVAMVGEGTATITANVAGKTATCKVTVKKKEVALESIKLNKTSVKGEVGDAEKLTVSYNPDNTTIDRTVNWSTSDKKVATVDKDGNVAMVGEGTATITANVAGKTATCKVTVAKKEVALESIQLNKTELNTKVGDKNKLVVSYNPNNTTVDKKVNWSSSDKKVVTVDKDGNVTSVAPGTATITANVAGKTATCKVTVSKKEVALESIKLDKTSVKGEVGDTEKLVVSYNPDNTTVDRTVNWSTSDKKVATVDKDGNVAMVGVGTATITAEVAGKTATCEVTVSKKEIALESIKLDKTAISGKAGDTEKLVVSYNPDNTTVDKTVNWSTSDTKVATVDKNGNVALVGIGTATITAEVAGKTATCVVTVSEEELVVESIKLDKTEAAMKKGDSLKLNAEVKANKDVAVVWTSSDESIATVDENGNVTALASGTVTITATAGDKTATCTITVTDDSEKPEKPEKPEQPQKPEQPNKPNKPEKPEQPNKPSKPEKPNKPIKPGVKPESKPATKPNAAPKTSDPAMLGLWGAALAVSGGVLAKLGLSKKKKDSDEE